VLDTFELAVVNLVNGDKRPMDGLQRSANAVRFSPDGKMLAAACEDRGIYLWDAATGELLTVLTGHEATPRRLAFTPDGRELASGDDAGIVRIWDLAAQRESMIIDAHEGPVRSMAVSPDGLTLVTGSLDASGGGEVRAWSARKPADQ
jgi:WD40 repeat protein